MGSFNLQRTSFLTTGLQRMLNENRLPLHQYLRPEMQSLFIDWISHNFFIIIIIYSEFMAHTSNRNSLWFRIPSNFVYEFLVAFRLLYINCSTEANMLKDGKYLNITRPFKINIVRVVRFNFWTIYKYQKLIVCRIIKAAI